VAAEFLSHRDTAAIMQCNGKLEKRHLIPSSFLGKYGTAKKYSVSLLSSAIKYAVLMLRSDRTQVSSPAMATECLLKPSIMSRSELAPS